MGAGEVPPEAVAESIDALQPGSDTWQQRGSPATPTPAAPLAHRTGIKAAIAAAAGGDPRPELDVPTCWNRHRRTRRGAVGADEAASAVGWQ
ncbi:hypothetical protein GS966_29675 [Rhodococcus hoagii]|nr:hypothetical protein [Prescottella equi]